MENTVLNNDLLIENHPNMIRKSKTLNDMPFDVAFKYFPSGYKFTKELRRELWRSHDKKCCYCGVEIETNMEMHIDHFIPKSKIINESIENLVCSCATCNLTKHSRDLEDFRFCMAVKNSILNGVVDAHIVKKLVSIGVEMPIKLNKFYFEIVLSGDNNE